MNKLQADRILSTARGLGAREAYICGEQVHVHLSAYTSSRERLGGMHVVVSGLGSSLRKFWHAETPAGFIWSRTAARVMGELDAARRQPC